MKFMVIAVFGVAASFTLAQILMLIYVVFPLLFNKYDLDRGVLAVLFCVVDPGVN